MDRPSMTLYGEELTKREAAWFCVAIVVFWVAGRIFRNK